MYSKIQLPFCFSLIVVSTFQLDEFEDAIENLMALGVPIVANGRFDFENDRNPEQWFKVELDGTIDDLLSGADPQEIVVQLQTLANNPNFESSNRYYYYLGLAYELLEDEDNAVNAYLLAWQDCCDTWQLATEVIMAKGFAVMARAKLEPVPFTSNQD